MCSTPEAAATLVSCPTFAVHTWGAGKPRRDQRIELNSPVIADEHAGAMAMIRELAAESADHGSVPAAEGRGTPHHADDVSEGLLENFLVVDGTKDGSDVLSADREVARLGGGAFACPSSAVRSDLAPEAVNDGFGVHAEHFHRPLLQDELEDNSLDVRDGGRGGDQDGRVRRTDDADK